MCNLSKHARKDCPGDCTGTQRKMLCKHDVCLAAHRRRPAKECRAFLNMSKQERARMIEQQVLRWLKMSAM